MYKQRGDKASYLENLNPDKSLRPCDILRLPELTLGKQPAFTTSLEIDFNNKYNDVLESIKDGFMLNQAIEIELYICDWQAGLVDKSDPQYDRVKQMLIQADQVLKAKREKLRKKKKDKLLMEIRRKKHIHWLEELERRKRIMEENAIKHGVEIGPKKVGGDSSGEE